MQQQLDLFLLLVHNGRICLLLIFSFKWSESEVIGMHQNLLALSKEVLPCSITSMVVSNDSFNQLLIRFIVGTLFVFVGLCVVMFDPV
jgi:hypothetical protein